MASKCAYAIVNTITVSTCLLATTIGSAADDTSASLGLAAAKKGDCAQAIALLEDAELRRHRPNTAFALAGCYVTRGRIVQAVEIYRALSKEIPGPNSTAQDRAAIVQSKKKVEELEIRIPTLLVKMEEELQSVQIDLDGVFVEDPSKPIAMSPDVDHVLRVRSPMYKEFREPIHLVGGERKEMLIRLTRIELKAQSEIPLQPKQTRPEKPPATRWLGVRTRAYSIPSFAMQWFGEGGQTTLFPSVDATFQMPLFKTARWTWALGYAGYSFGPMPWKSQDAPNTDYEMVESTLSGLVASTEIAFSVPLNSDKTWRFEYGAGAGLVWMFTGDIFRTQAYPTGNPDDPATYQACNGPADPSGTALYCNSLDKDATHYNGYSEPSWFSGGKTPVLYPWIALPEIGIEYIPSSQWKLQLQLGLSTTGLFAGMAGHYGVF